MFFGTVFGIPDGGLLGLYGVVPGCKETEILVVAERQIAWLRSYHILCGKTVVDVTVQ